MSIRKDIKTKTNLYNLIIDEMFVRQRSEKRLFSLTKIDKLHIYVTIQVIITLNMSPLCLPGTEFRVKMVNEVRTGTSYMNRRDRT